jgi:hypothetical protein
MRPGFDHPTPSLLEREREKGFVSHAGHIAHIRRCTLVDAVFEMMHKIYQKFIR